MLSVFPKCDPPIIKGLSLVAAPSVEPVTLSDVKGHLRGIVGTGEDNLLQSLISAVTKKVEAHINRAIIDQTWSASYDDVPVVNMFEIPRSPLKSIVSIHAFDVLNGATLVPSSSFFVDTASDPGRIVLSDGASWPSITARQVNSFVVQFVAGYGLRDDVPADIKQAILQSVGFFYKNREGVINKKEIKGLPMIARNLLSAYRFINV